MTLLLLAACIAPVASESPVPRPSQPALSHAPLPEAVAVAPASRVAIAERPLPFDAEREQLTLAYRAAHQGPEHAASTRIEPRVVVLHWTGGPSAESAWQTFAPSRLQGRPELQGAGALNVSAHFLVDAAGTVTRLMPEDRMARHTIGLNHVGIAIENVGDGDRWPLTPAQVQANAALVRDLKERWPGLTHLIGHHEADALRGTPLFLELDPGYRNPKADPGAAFLAAVRAEVADLGLQGAP